MSSLELAPSTTALVLIDLQNGIVGMSPAPHAGADVVERSRRLADRFHQLGSPVVYVRVDMNDFLRLPVDLHHRDPDGPPLPAILSELVENAGRQPQDTVITKRHWGAFAGTALEQELRQRGIKTVVIAGIATSIGVESTVRQGTGLGFAFVLVEDACSDRDEAAHRYAVEKILPRLSHVRSTDEVLAALA